jgi:hypothetical protein
MAFDKAKYIQHPSFGTVSISRGTCSESMNLFGSSLKQRSFIELKISHAELMRDLNRDVVFGRNTIISVYMSPSQFADMVTSLNIGEGVPCTINYMSGNKIPEPILENKRVQFDNEFAELIADVMSDTNENVENIKQILNKNSLGKHDRENILKEIGFLRRKIEGHIPFVKKQFTEQMDTTVIEAKNEIINLFEYKLKELGLQKYREQLALELLEDKSGEKIV